MLRRLATALTLFGLTLLPAVCDAQKMVRLKNQPPAGSWLTLQLTDGTVLSQSGNESTFYKLTPDNTGSYVNGTWTQVATLPAGYQPLYFASAVLADGRVAVLGGEYNFDQFAFTNLGAIYDPVKNQWSTLDHPKHWFFIGDSVSVVLPNGNWVVGEKMHKNLASLDPNTMKWTELSHTGKRDWNAEEGWTLLPDGSFLTSDVRGHPHTERYFPDQGKWVSQGPTPNNLRGPRCCSCIPYGNKGKCYLPPGEIGPAILRPDGTVFATGAVPKNESTAHTAIYHQADPLHPRGNWTTGPDFLNGDDAGDSSAALLPSGNVLVATLFGSLYEFDGKTLTRENVGTVGAYTSLMMLPTGEVLVGGYEVYQPKGTYQQSWAPTISTYPSTATRGSTYQISGTQFNGLSQGAAFGDELETATNYPLVRITNNKTSHVFYARTHDHSTMGVATGGTTVSTNFDVPSKMETGASSLEVVANGIPSTPVSITVK